MDMHLISRAEIERDLFLRLLELGHCAELEPVLRAALSLAVEATGAAGGHIHVFGDSGEEPEWSLSLGRTDGAEVRKKASRGIEAEVMATGSVVQTPSALLDPRFASRPSVREHKLEAVLCAPIGSAPPEGVVYLHGKEAAGPFQEPDVKLIETICRHLGPTIRTLAAQHRSAGPDPTSLWRERLRVDGLVGRSEAVASVLEFISVAASADIPVLLTGESGTGKTAVARSVHDNSRRATAPFEEINCASIQGTLFEAELFGSVRGAFTDAQDRAGRVATAEGGTLFLDEVGEIHPSNQARLLQFLQSGRYNPVGSDQSRQGNVRIIAATNRNLEEAVEDGSFRRDLYFRLNVFPFRLPALSERREDRVILARHFVELAARKYQRAALPLSPGAQLVLATMPFPGNVRELENSMDRALVRACAQNAHQIEASHLTGSEPREEKRPLTYQEAMRECQRKVIAAALECTRGNVLAAARELDITRAHLYNLIKVHGLQRK